MHLMLMILGAGRALPAGPAAAHLSGWLINPRQTRLVVPVTLAQLAPGAMQSAGLLP
jgi:hypothetical protein